MGMVTTLIYSNRDLAGTYKETKIDTLKKVSNRLVSISGKFYNIILKDGTKLEIVGKRSFDKWCKSNEYLTDF